MLGKLGYRVLAAGTPGEAIGLAEAPDYRIADRVSQERPAVDLEEALRKAYERRADLKALAVKRLALEESV